MISIIVPFYNTEKYFEKCLSSIKAQTFSDFECLLIDDGSTDLSREIAKKFTTIDSRFILLNKDHIGYPACKNLGIDKARGKYICFIDSDDYVEKYHLENLYNALISTDSDISNCSYVYMNNSECKISNKKYEYDFEVFEGADNILRKYLTNTYPWNKLFKKSLFENLRFENVEALSDTLLNHKVFERASKTVYTKYKSYYYRKHDESITYNVRNKSATYWPYRVNVYIEVCSYLSKYPALKDTLRALMRGEVNFCFPHLSLDQVAEFEKNTELQNLLDCGGIKNK